MSNTFNNVLKFASNINIINIFGRKTVFQVINCDCQIERCQGYRVGNGNVRLSGIRHTHRF